MSLKRFFLIRLGRVLALHCYRWGWSTTHSEVDPIWLLAPHDLSIALHVLGRMPAPVAATGAEAPTRLVLKSMRGRTKVTIVIVNFQGSKCGSSLAGNFQKGHS